MDEPMDNGHVLMVQGGTPLKKNVLFLVVNFGDPD